MAKVAIMGYGTVGSGVYDIIETNSDKLCHNSGEPIEVKYILDIRDFNDHPKKELFTKNFDDILNDGEVTVVAEVMGGLHPAYEFTKQLLLSGKSVVTSNKELVATYGTELLQVANEKNVNYMFEASVGGGIPIIRPIHQDLTANRIEKIAGILNGTTNYILNEMIEKGKSFEDALKDAQNNGYAERNPAADIEGHDACRKIAILSSLASGLEVDYNNIETEGITSVSLEDVNYADSFSAAIKLIGYSEFSEDGKIYSIVSPMIVPKTNLLSHVNEVFNAIMVKGNCVGETIYYGAGAGKLPTASAVVADVVDSVKHRLNSKKISWKKPQYDIYAKRDSKRFAYFVRTKSTKAEIENIFTNIEYTKSLIDGEVAFITDKFNVDEMEQKLNSLQNVISSYRILD